MMEANFDREKSHKLLTDSERVDFLNAIRMNQNTNVENQNSWIEKNYIFLIAAYSAYLTIAITILNNPNTPAGLYNWICAGLIFAFTGALLFVPRLSTICDGFYKIVSEYGVIKKRLENRETLERSYNQLHDALQVSTHKHIGKYAKSYWPFSILLVLSLLCMLTGFIDIIFSHAR